MSSHQMRKFARAVVSILYCALLSQSLAAEEPASKTSPKALQGRPGARGEAFGRLVVRGSSFRGMEHGLTRGCESTAPPQPIATPNPMVDSTDNTELTVNFVVGTDGRVHSALVLEGNRLEDARLVLATVRLWRYRPAVCNGAPTEAEAKVEFSTPANRF